MRIIVATVQSPFVRGGAELQAASLVRELELAGHQVEIVAIPFAGAQPKMILQQMRACRLLNVRQCGGGKSDLMIGLRFPAYLMPHPRKVFWVIHQHRPAYDRWGDLSLGPELSAFPDGEHARQAITQADSRAFSRARAVYAISKTVASRIAEFNGIEAKPLYHPPPFASDFTCRPAEPYFFFPSRINPMKRQWLVLDALKLTRYPVQVRFAGGADHPGDGERLRRISAEYGLADRVRFLGVLDHGSPELVDLYARALGVLFPTRAEDMGYVTLEAMLASKPVIVCTDAGGPLEVVEPNVTGLVADPTPEALAEAMDRLWEDRTLAREMGERGRAAYEARGISWQRVFDALLV